LASNWLDNSPMKRNVLATVVMLLAMVSTTYAADRDSRFGEGAVTQAQPSSRGVALSALYGTLITLQAYDGWSTISGVRMGAAEINPALAGVASNTGAMWAVKAGATGASIYAAERLWRRNRRVQAVATMVAVNGIMAMVAARNAAVVQRLK